MNGLEYIALMRKRSALRQELRELDQLACEYENEGHRLVGYCEWGHSGKECSRCHKRFKELCHTVDCKCSFPHSTDSNQRVTKSG